MNFCIGFDFGTSGARAIVINAQHQLQLEVQQPFVLESTADQWLSQWKTALFDLIAQIPAELRSQTRAIAINGTSGTVLLCDSEGNPLGLPMLYNDGRGASVMEQLRRIAPQNHPVLSATSSLAKVLWWQQQWNSNSGGLAATRSNTLIYLLHQADWLGFLLHGKVGVTDYHNALKLGYDVVNLRYPHWLVQGIHRSSPAFVPQLPQVLAPGTPVGLVTSDIANRFQFPQTCQVCAGTTDSIAAFLASGATTPGDAVTSLGSTLVIKLLSRTPVNSAEYGIYSHRLGNLWLTGGASNTGGAVLRQFFTDAELSNLSQEINPRQSTGLDYYPLLQPGDRFPINDPNLPPRMEPRPESSAKFLQGLLEGMARIEAQGYQRLQELGATPLTRVYTAGGGAKNLAWTTIRAHHLKVPLLNPVQTQAAYGTAVLAQNGIESITTIDNH
ncbi:MAG: FGGY-family carbohydrate kinase [Microcoleaceae cyanobacterium]